MGIEHQSVGDSGVYLNDKTALGEVVAQWHDTVIADLRSIPADDFFVEVDFFERVCHQTLVVLIE